MEGGDGERDKGGGKGVHVYPKRKKDVRGTLINILGCSLPDPCVLAPSGSVIPQ